jgi:serine/threonine protein kinase
VSASLADRLFGNSSRRYVFHGSWMRHCAEIAQQLVAEAVIWRQLEHPNLVPFLGIVQDQNNPYALLHIITPRMSQGTLLDFIKSPSYEANIQRVQLVCAGGSLKNLMQAYLSFETSRKPWSICTRCSWFTATSNS